MVGKWYGERMTVVRVLGSGTHGSVYLVTWKGRRVAAKVACDATVISSEINRLHTLNQAQETFPGPKLFYYDDAEQDGCIYPFYLMSYERGQPFHECMQSGMAAQGMWLWVVLRLLEHLHALHEIGYVFGDWKPEHVVVNPVDIEIRFVDLGGMTPIGQGLRQWTDMYDRGYWRAGLRQAEPAYDVFAVTLLILTAVWQCPLWTAKPEQRHMSALCDIIRDSKNVPFTYRRVFERAVQGKIQSARKFAEELVTAAGSTIQVQVNKSVHHTPFPRHKWLRESCFTGAAKRHDRLYKKS